MIKSASEVRVGETFRVLAAFVPVGQTLPKLKWLGPVQHIDAGEPGCLAGNVILNYESGAYECAADTQLETR